MLHQAQAHCTKNKYGLEKTTRLRRSHTLKFFSSLVTLVDQRPKEVLYQTPVQMYHASRCQEEALNSDSLLRGSTRRYEQQPIGLYSITGGLIHLSRLNKSHFHISSKVCGV
ncbi:hypothetical protein ATANTOWER_000741 [Ataeniobius toweri]|uniref:Uncharacterized protein n=1 Tax=Ataeniobius toweri TaxID=208326 RepID=A0ABU7C5G7_9TELE|nr:hypothetical protein [Ataeniobius toweri]